MRSSSLASVFAALFLFWSAFALAAVPTATTDPASSLTTSSALLNGSGTPGSERSTGYFRIATADPGDCDDSFGTRVPASGGTDLGSGSSDVDYSITATGLVPGTTYWFCAIVQNASGTDTGAVLSFTVPAPPLVITNPADNITATSMTLRASGNPLGSSTTGWFRYSSTDPGSCNDSFGTRTPSSGGTSLGAGSAPVDFARSISSLQPGVTYYVCAIASNAFGTSFSAVYSVTTDANLPTVSTTSAQSVVGTGATFRASVNPGGAETTVWFRYGTVSPGTCNDSFGIRAPAMAGTVVPAGNSAVTVTQPVTGLTPGGTYYLCAIGENSEGMTFGSVLTLITPLMPTVTTTVPTSVTNSSATLNGSANPNRASTTGWFRYSATAPMACNDTFGSRAPISGGSGLGSGTTSRSFNQSVSGLTPGATYYYCAIASSSEGTVFGDVLSFTTATAPAVLTGDPTAVGTTSATLSGAADPNGSFTTVWFRYSTTEPSSCTDSFGTRAPSSSGSSAGSGTDPVNVARSISSLQPGETYYYCAIASNSYGTVYGAVKDFTTTAMAPTASTSSVSPFTGTTATLRGSSNPNGAATGGWFRYSTISPGTCNDSFGTRAPATGANPLGDGNSTVSFTQDITGLTPGETYYVCAIAENAEGRAFGSVVTLTTALPAEVTTTAASGLTSTSATLNGTAIPNRASTTAWFRYSATAPMACNDTFGSRAPTSGATSLGSGTTSRSFNQSISGLSVGVTYYYCAIATSSEGTVFGEVLSFNTLTEPTVETVEASSLTSTRASLNGIGDPNGSFTTGWFRYSTTEPASCDDSFGTRAPSSSGSSLGSGMGDTPFTRSISSLLPGETYYFCAIASNSYGQVYGEVLSFTTPTAPPTAITSSVNTITGTTATFNGSSNAGGAPAIGWFRYATISPGTCNDSFGTRAPTTNGVAIGSGNTNVAFSQAVTGLEPGTTYYVCAFASNGSDLAMGSVVSFTTPLPPEVTTVAASSLTSTSATLNGTANPNRANSSGWFRYSATAPMACNDTFGSRAPLAGGTGLGSGTTARSFNQSISGLTAGVTYYYCAIASSTEGTEFGDVLSFTTVDAPTVSTEPATLVTTTSARLNGTADPNGSFTSGWFRYSTTHPGSCTDGFGTRAPSSSGSSLGSSDGDTDFSRSISGLQPGQTYYFCAIASNAYGTAYGDVDSFMTPVDAPSVSTNSVTNLTSGSATLRGSANPNGGNTVAWLRYSTANPIDCNDIFGTRAPEMGGSSLGDGNSSASFEQAITGLSAGTTYYVCAVAQNGAGASFGSVVTFTTPLPPTVTTNVVSSLTNSSATLNGAAIPNRAATTGWFRYSLTEPESCDDMFGARAPASGGTSVGSGTSSSSFNRSISGLSAGTLYYYCAIASSAEGTSFGEVLTFTTLTVPDVLTTAVTNIGASSATFNGEVDPNGSFATGWFRYGTTDPGSSCDGTFGSRWPSSSGSNVGSGTDPVSYSRSISGLVAGQTYYVCAGSNNSYGTSYGNVVSFETPASAPTVSTNSATLLTGTTATLRGSANPGGSPTGGWFRYATVSPGTCNDSFGTRAPDTSGVPLGAGNANVSYEQAITGLTAGTTYYVCAIAQNGVDKVWGSVVTFTTPLPPVVSTLAARNLTNTSATIEGRGTPNRAATTGWFRYSFTDPVDCDDSFGSRAPVTGATNLGSGTTPTTFNQSVTGLSVGTTYYYCAIVMSSEGMVFGEVMSFTTLDAPVVVTTAATQVSANSATLNGGVNANGSFTTAWYRYSATDPGACSDSFGSRAPTSGGTSIGSGTSNLPFSRSVSNLTPGTTYYFCAIASSSYGTTFGPLLSFTTPATEPTVRTLSATLITSTGADINGTANPNGAPTVGWFRYHTSSPGTCNDTFGVRAPTMGGVSLGDGTDTQSFAQTLDNLAPGTTYYVCAIAQNAIGLSFGSVVQVTTRRPPTVATLAATPVTSTTATLNASGTPNGNTTTGWFRYDINNPVSCNDDFGTRVPASGGTNLGSGSNAISFDEPITGLSPGTTYYVCALGSSSIGTSTGEVLSFTTPATAPSVTTLAPSSISVTSVRLEGAATPNGAASLGWFRYATTSPQNCDDSFGTRVPASGGVALGSGTGSVSFSRGVGGLAPDTTYYACALAENSAGLGVGTVVSFTTPASCVGGDSDNDGVCDDADFCEGDDLSGDEDLDGICDDLDVCMGDDTAGDSDGDGVCDDEDFGLTVGPLSGGSSWTLTARNAPPGRNVFFMLSTRAPTGAGPCGPTAPTVCLDIERPTVLGTATADASGTATLTITVPPSVPSGAMGWLQSAWLNGASGDVTPVEMATAQ